MRGRGAGAIGPDAAIAIPYLIDALNTDSYPEFKNEHYTLYSALKEITTGFSDPTPSSQKYSEWLNWWERNREYYPTQ